ncbi:MAG: hypothetical protein ABUT39_25225 [Acidobacteriota bacterium]
MSLDDASDSSTASLGPRAGNRTFRDQRGNRLDMSWRAAADRVRVQADYVNDHGNTYWTVAADLDRNRPQWTFNIPPAGNRRGMIELVVEEESCALRGNLPVSAYAWSQEEIARWRRIAGEIEDALPGEAAEAEEIGEDPACAPCLPAGPGCGWIPAGSVIRNPACPQELLRVLSVYPAPAAPPLPCGSLLGFVLLPKPEDLPFYNQLAAIPVGPDRWSQMIEAAVQFAASDPAFVPSLASLDTPASAYPLLASQLRCLRGEVSLEEILKTVDTFLFAFGVGPLDAYLASSYLQEIEARVWQSLFAVSLGAPARPPLPDNLVLALRIGHFLRDLQRELLEGPPSPLTQPEGRDEVLGATVLVPPGAVPTDPACLDVPPPLESGWVQALGVGDLSLVYQCLKGYDLGEVASVVNVMEHERLELSARELARREEVDEIHRSDESGREEAEERASQSDLRNELEDVVAAEALCSQYNNLSQTYSGTQVTLSGTWQGSDGLKERSDRQVRDLAESLTRRAASRLARTVTEARVRRRFLEQERIDARDIDNRQGSDRLLGIYRWLHKIYEVTVRDAGKRLVVEFEIADPAAEYLLHIRNRHGVPLTRPKPPEFYKVFSWQDVTAENYLWLASLYRIEVPPPPPAEVGLLRSFQSQPPLFQAELEVPAGYSVTVGSVQYLLGDVSDNLVGYVGTAQFSYPGTPPTAILGLLSTPSTNGGPGGGSTCPALTDPFTYPQVPYQPVQETVTLDLAGATGTIPASMLSTATWFSATVSLSCSLPADSELLKAWQIRTYDALVAGYLRSLERYEAELRLRIGADSDADRRRIERRQLGLRAFQILLARRAPTVPPPSEAGVLSLFESAFAWDEMTYAFHPWPPPPETCEPDPAWPGQALIHGGEDDLFERFLNAGSARVLVPVRPGYAAAVLFYLHFGLPWPGAAGKSPAAESDLPVLAELRRPVEVWPGASWRLEIPTSMPVLQAGSEFPTFPCLLEIGS